MSTPHIPSYVPSLLLGLSSLLACVAHDTSAFDSSPPEALHETDDSPLATTVTTRRGTPMHSAPAECAPFRDPGLDEEKRVGRLAYLTNTAAKMLDDEPPLAETVLWIAELELQGGNVNGACEALRRLIDVTAEGPYTETGRCWHDSMCVAAVDLSCPTGFSAEDEKGCAPVATCSIDVDQPLGPQLAGACDGSDVACCAKEGGLEQVRLHAATRSEDAEAVARHRRDMIALYERSCDQGYASICAYVAKVVREGDDSEQPDTTRADRLRARACALGHHASCTE